MRVFMPKLVVCLKRRERDGKEEIGNDD